MMSKSRAIELYEISKSRMNEDCISWPTKQVRDLEATKSKELENAKSKKKKVKGPKWIMKSKLLSLKEVRSNHRKWCDTYSEGVTHFGLHPSTWNLVENSRQDVFHLRSAVTRKMIHQLRDVINNYGTEVWNAVTDLLSRIWRPFFLSQWHNRVTMNRLQGTENIL